MNDPRAPTPPPATRSPVPVADRAAVRSVTSAQLFDGAAEVQIDHRGARYRLKQTSLGKLILTK